MNYFVTGILTGIFVSIISFLAALGARIGWDKGGKK